MASFVIGCTYTALQAGAPPDFSLLTPTTCTGLLGLALLFTVVEALSPHGWDNALLQIVPAWAAAQFLLT